MNSILEKILIVSLCFIVLLSDRDTPTEIAYVIIIMMVITMCFVSLALKLDSIYCIEFPFFIKGTVIQKISYIVLFYSWIGIILSWLAGVIVGVLNDVPIIYVFRNFFGLNLYLLLPILYLVKPKIYSLIKFIIFAGVFQSCYALYYTYGKIINPQSFLVSNSLSEARSVYSASFAVFYPLFALAFSKYLFGKRIYALNRSITLISLDSIYFCGLSIVVYAILIVIPAMSKGYILGLVMLVFTIMILSTVVVQKHKVSIPLIQSVLMISILLALIYYNIYDIIVYTFNPFEGSNQVRSTQYDYLVDEFSLYGAGLGAKLKSGYDRSSVGYGFELTYINIMHKLGIYSIFIFSTYLFTIILSIYNIIKKIFVFESVFAFGLMFFMVPGAGNPLLLAPIPVILHVISIYVLVLTMVQRQYFNKQSI